LKLDENLAEGDYRRLTDEELKLLLGSMNKSESV
jgi:hypothetical protein